MPDIGSSTTGMPQQQWQPSEGMQMSLMEQSMTQSLLLLGTDAEQQKIEEKAQEIYASTLQIAEQILQRGYSNPIQGPVLPDAYFQPVAGAHGPRENTWLTVPSIQTLNVAQNFLVANVMKKIMSLEGELREKLLIGIEAAGRSAAELTRKAGMEEASQYMMQAAQELASAGAAALSLAATGLGALKAMKSKAVKIKKAEIADLQEQKQTAQTQKGSQEADLADIRRQQETLTAEIGEISADLNTRRRQHEEQTQTVSSDQIDATADDLGLAVPQEIRDLETIIAGKQEALSALETQETNTQTKIDKQNQQIEALDKQIQTEEGKLQQAVMDKRRTYAEITQPMREVIQNGFAGAIGIFKALSKQRQVEAQSSAQIEQLQKEMLEKIFQGSLDQARKAEEIVSKGIELEKNMQQQLATFTRPA